MLWTLTMPNTCSTPSANKVSYTASPPVISRMVRPPGSCPPGGDAIALLRGVSNGLPDPVRVRPKFGFVERRDHLARPDNAVDSLQVVLRQAYRGRKEVVLELLHRPRPDDGAGHPRLLGAPRQRKLRECRLFRVRYRLQSLDDVEDAVVH